MKMGRKRRYFNHFAQQDHKEVYVNTSLICCIMIDKSHKISHVFVGSVNTLLPMSTKITSPCPIFSSSYVSHVDLQQNQMDKLQT